MLKRKVLIPIDNTKRSLHSLKFIKTLYTPEDVDVTIMMVKEDTDTMRSENEFELARKEIDNTLYGVAYQFLEEYSVKTHVGFGNAGDEILDFAENANIDIVIMTKSSRKGFARIIGSVTSHVVRNAKCIVMIVPE